MFFKRVLLGALGWYVVFTLLYFPIIYAAIPNYVCIVLLGTTRLSIVLSPEAITYMIYFISFCVHLPSVICASVVAVLLIEGRNCYWREMITASLCWLLCLAAIMLNIKVLWNDEIFKLLYLLVAGVAGSAFNHDEKISIITDYLPYQIAVAVPTAILGAITYCGLRAWFSRKQIEDNS